MPILGILGLAYPLWAVSNPAQAAPYNLVPIVVVVWIIVGIVLYLYYRSKSPEKIAALGAYIADDDLPLGESSAQHPTGADEAANHPETIKD
jgi:hypothetical protein